MGEVGHRSDPEIVGVQAIPHTTGMLSVVDAREAGFQAFERVYFIHTVAPGSVRGSHAHRELQQLLIAVSGSLDVETETSGGKERFHLDSPDQGLLLRPFTWRTLKNFSSGAVCAVLASHSYDEADYIRDYAEFRRELRFR